MANPTSITQASRINNLREDRLDLHEQQTDSPIEFAVAQIKDIGNSSDRSTSPIDPASVTVEQASWNVAEREEEEVSIGALSGTRSPILTSSLIRSHFSPPLMPLGNIQPEEPVIQLVQGVVWPLTRALDPGISVALDFCKNGIEQLARGNDAYAELLLLFISFDSEEHAIQELGSWEDEKLKLLIGDSIGIGPSNEKNIMMDALRFAALNGRFNLFRYLLNKMKDFHIPIDKTDRFGWNLAHDIALHPDGASVINNIPEIAALANRGNNMGATALDFIFWLSEPTPIAIAALGDEHGLIDVVKFQIETRSNYWIRPRFTPGALLRLCFELPTIDRPSYLSNFLGPKITNYIDGLGGETNKLKIRKMEGKNVPKQLQGEWECLTSRKVAKGEVLALYSGTVTHSRWKGPTQVGGKAFHVTDDFWVDADLGGGSLVQFINHGFPNCACFPHLYRGIPVDAVIALEDIPANTPLFLSYGPGYFAAMGITPANLNQNGIDRYLSATKKLATIPFIEFHPEGTSCCYGSGGKMLLKRSNGPASESQAIEGWSNKIRLEYLASYHSDEMRKRLEKLPYQWLIKEFKK